MILVEVCLERVMIDMICRPRSPPRRRTDSDEDLVFCFALVCSLIMFVCIVVVFVFV